MTSIPIYLYIPPNNVYCSRMKRLQTNSKEYSQTVSRGPLTVNSQSKRARHRKDREDTISNPMNTEHQNVARTQWKQT